MTERWTNLKNENSLILIVKIRHTKSSNLFAVNRFRP